MGWSIGFDSNWNRDIGYGVPAFCDHPGCGKIIDRGLGYVCGGEPKGGEKGCGLYFCGEHQVGFNQQCECCSKRRKKSFVPSPDLPHWTKHKLTHWSWHEWRCENVKKVEELRNNLLFNVYTEEELKPQTKKPAGEED